MRYISLFIILLISFTSAFAQRKGRVDHAAVAAEAASMTKKAIHNYDLDVASEQLSRWEESLDALKRDYPQDLEDMRNLLRMTRNMLERVEKIEIVDKIVVDSADFFNHYRLSPDAGLLCDSTALPDAYASTNPRVVYIPQSDKEIFWAMPTDSGNTSIFVADVLDNGEIDTPVMIGQVLGDADTDFPFLMQDGVTLYYGATGEASLGGYDIFMSRRNPDGEMMQPQNMGMPYNSPFNDYLLAIDETRDLGWWASDREQIPGKVTIYVFVPSKMRVNYEPDSDKIADFALLRNIDMTHDLDSRLASFAESDTANEEFFFSLGDGRVYTRLDQFKNPQARQAMNNLLKRMFDTEMVEVELDNLRLQYASGDKSVADQILRLEKHLRDAQATIKRNSNQVISLENKIR